MYIKTTIGFLSVALSAGIASGATLNLGTIELQANLADQIVALPDVVGPGEQVVGLNFNIQVEDGGPLITGADIIGSGTIFEGNNTGQSGGGSLNPRLFEATTTTASGTVEADGTLAFVTFDTTGLFSGTFELNMSDTTNGPTELLAQQGQQAVNVLTIEDGQLLVVPEPSSVALALLACIGFFRFPRRP